MKVKIIISLFVLAFCILFGISKSTCQTTLLTKRDTIPDVKLSIKNDGQYSKSFIAALRQFVSRSPYKEAELVDSLIFFKGRKNPPIQFPSFPKINRSYILSATLNEYYYELNILRRNYSDIEAHILLKENSKVIFDQKMTVILNPSFIQAGDSYEDEISGFGYTVFHYSSNENANDCTISISVSPSVFESRLKGKIEQISCSDTATLKIVEKRPTLSSKVE